MFTDCESYNLFVAGMWKRKRKRWKRYFFCGSGSGSAKIHRFHIGGKNGERKEIGSAILRRRTNARSINIKKLEQGGVV